MANQHNPLNDLYDIYGMWHVPWWQTSYFYATLAGLLLVVVCGISWWGIKKYRAHKDRLTPWQRALRDIKMLDEHDASRAQQFYYDLSAIIKRYIHERYGMAVYDKTDYELMSYLATLDFPVELLEPLRTLLHGSVAIKFAQAAPLENQMEQDRVRARMIIEKTIPSAS